METHNLRILLISALIMILVINPVSAKDQLKPILEKVYNQIKEVVDFVSGYFEKLFPGLTNSVNNLFFFELEDKNFQWLSELRELIWLFYIAAFIVIIAFLIQLYQLSKHYLYNTIAGMVLLLICIHLLGVKIKFTILNLILVVLLGIPGAIITLAFHYLGVPI